MNQQNTTTTIKDLCCIFCCPPWPSKVVAKLAFLPPNASYEFIKLSESNQNNNNNSEVQNNNSSSSNNNNSDNDTETTNVPCASNKSLKNKSSNILSLKLMRKGKSTKENNNNKENNNENLDQNQSSSKNNQKQTEPNQNMINYNILPDAEYRLKPNPESVGYIPYEFDKDQILPSFVKTKRGNKIACTYIKYTSNKELYRRKPSKFVILFSHGNAVDIGQMPPFYIGLAARLKTDIFSYDYSGYGLSSGSPNEANLYADIRAAYKYLKDHFKYKDEQIILYGQSIGTVPTIDLASQTASSNIAAVILHSPLLSGLRVIVPNARNSCFDPFPSIEKMDKVKSKVLVIHGTEDEVIDFHHGLQIYELAKEKYDPLWVEGAGHNDIEHYAVYTERLIMMMKDLDETRRKREAKSGKK